jgi:polar amino acid transport system substrate-binding protein
MSALRAVSALGFGIAFISSTFMGTADAQGLLETARRTGKITVGIYNQVPWGFQTPDGKIGGQAVDVLMTAFKAMGINEFTPVISEFSALIPGLQAKRFDVIAAGLFIRPDRCKLVAFGNPDIKMGDGLLVRAGNPHKIHSYQDIAANPMLKIGTARGNVQAQSATVAGVPADRQLLFPDNQSALAGLIAGRVDAVSATAASIVTMSNDAKASGVERALPFTGLRDAQGHEQFGYPALAFRLEDANFRDAYNVQLTRMRADGTLLEINKRYGFNENDMPPADKTAEALCNP